MHTIDHHTIVFQALPEDLSDSFCIISAWNPDGQDDWPGPNQERDANLATHLEALKLPHARVTALSPDESRADPGWAVTCPLDQGLKLGREFRQKRLYRIEDGNLSLVRSKDGKQTALGPFAARLRNPRLRQLFTIYLGSPQPRARLLPTEEFDIRVRAARFLDSFTITRAEGFFRHQAEDTLLITSATSAPLKVIGLAGELLQYTGQEGVGISHNGIYQRVTSWSEPKFLLRVWGFPTPCTDLTPSMSAPLP